MLIRRLTITISLFTLVACASSQPTADETPRTAQGPGAMHRGGGMGGGGRGGGMGGWCNVPGTAVNVKDVDDGVALSFTTGSGDVAELRRRVRHMAEMHERHHEQGMMRMPASTASAEDIEGGARMTLRPKDPAQLGELRAEAHRRGDGMAARECPMMEDRG